ncbi:unnamed protein product [Larinioides sclopetarius]|uniref:Uncharacterized protein n=1 Tax=Larinioides sclopetarius TaxID=280406 RepID=A0AAV1ZRA0_9ARAC
MVIIVGNHPQEEDEVPEESHIWRIVGITLCVILGICAIVAVVVILFLPTEIYSLSNDTKLQPLCPSVCLFYDRTSETNVSTSLTCNWDEPLTDNAEGGNEAGPSQVEIVGAVNRLEVPLANNSIGVDCQCDVLCTAMSPPSNGQ